MHNGLVENLGAEHLWDKQALVCYQLSSVKCPAKLHLFLLAGALHKLAEIQSYDWIWRLNEVSATGQGKGNLPSWDCKGWLLPPEIASFDGSDTTWITTHGRKSYPMVMPPSVWHLYKPSMTLPYQWLFLQFFCRFEVSTAPTRLKMDGQLSNKPGCTKALPLQSAILYYYRQTTEVV